MPFAKSTPEELAASAAQVDVLEAQILALKAAGKRVHVIWDVDRVLVSGRSDDAFTMLGFNVQKYFTFEERLIAEKMEDGPWAALARKCGELQESQDIVTARSSFLAMRVMLWCLDYHLPMRWQLFIGHQPKHESYRIILQSFAKEPDVHVFMIDDAKKHVDAFTAVAAELGMSDRCRGIESIIVRAYDEDELRREVDGVMNLTGDTPQLVDVREKVSGADYGRWVLAVPDPRKAIRSMFMGLRTGHTWMAAIVERHRAALESAMDEMMPGKPKTVENMYWLFELTRSP